MSKPRRTYSFAEQSLIDADRRARIAACERLGVRIEDAIMPDSTSGEKYEDQVLRIAELDEGACEIDVRDLIIHSRNYRDHYHSGEMHTK